MLVKEWLELATQVGATMSKVIDPRRLQFGSWHATIAPPDLCEGLLELSRYISLSDLGLHRARGARSMFSAVTFSFQYTNCRIWMVVNSADQSRPPKEISMQANNARIHPISIFGSMMVCSNSFPLYIPTHPQTKHPSTKKELSAQKSISISLTTLQNIHSQAEKHPNSISK